MMEACHSHIGYQIICTHTPPPQPRTSTPSFLPSTMTLVDISNLFEIINFRIYETFPRLLSHSV